MASIWKILLRLNQLNWGDCLELVHCSALRREEGISEKKTMSGLNSEWEIFLSQAFTDHQLLQACYYTEEETRSMRTKQCTDHQLLQAIRGTQPPNLPNLLIDLRFGHILSQFWKNTRSQADIFHGVVINTSVMMWGGTTCTRILHQ